jgi:fructokinase
MEIMKRIESAGFDPIDIQVDEIHPTGTVQVRLNEFGVPSFKIIPSVAYDYIEYLPDIHSKLIKSANLLYFGTIVQRTEYGFAQIQRFLRCKQTPCVSFYDINLRPNCYSDEIIEQSLYNTDILKLNTEELKELGRITGRGQDTPSLIRDIMSKYSIETIAMTKGHVGSELYTTEGASFVTAEPISSMVDTVGAGDAFAAMLAIGHLEGWESQTTLSRATVFASQICTIEGAIPDSENFYEAFRKQKRNGG